LILHIISRILFRLIGECGHLSCSAIARKITPTDEAGYSGTSASSADSALHPGKDFAVSPPMSPSGLNYRHRMSIVVFFLSEKNVSVRTYWIAPYGYYPLPFISVPLKSWTEGSSDFPLAQEKLRPETAQCKTTNIILCQTKKRKTLW